MTKKNTYSNKTKEELLTLVSEKRRALHDFRFSVSGSKIRNVREGRALRKDIARALTALTLQ